MSHKTVAEKIEERKAAPMKLVASQSNLGVVGPVASIPPYRISPDEEYMNEQQEKHFLNVLQAWKRQLMEDVDKTVNHLKDDAENYADLNDRATQEEEFNLELRTRDRERKLLKKIDETIMLIENGDFGYCEACGVEIGLPRLEVRPTATQCIDCKTFEEIREKQLTL
jgi:DnaK suppressor protein